MRELKNLREREKIELNQYSENKEENEREIVII